MSDNYNLEYSISLKDDGEVLITLPNLFEIRLSEFSTYNTVKNELIGTSLIKVVSCSYPLDGGYKLSLPNYPDEDDSDISLQESLSSVKLKSTLFSATFLQVVTLSQNIEQNTFLTCNSKLWIGKSVSVPIPNGFAEKLQNLLLTGELTND